MDSPRRKLSTKSITRKRIIIAIVITAIVVSSVAFTLYITRRRSPNPNDPNDLIVPEASPFFPSGASIQFLNPNGTLASQTVVSVYVHPVNQGSGPLTANSSSMLVVRSLSTSEGMFTFPFNGLVASVALGWRNDLAAMGGQSYANEFQTSFAVTATEQLANNTTWSVITYLRYSPGLLVSNLNNSAFQLSYSVVFNLFINNSAQPVATAPASARATATASPACVGGRCLHCTPGYYWSSLGSTITPNLWIPTSWVNNKTSYAGGSIGYTLGYSGEDTVFEVGAYNTVKGAWSVNTSSPTYTPAYGSVASEAFTNYKAAAIFINASIQYTEWQYDYVNYYCQVTKYSDYEADVYVNNIEISGSSIVTHVAVSQSGKGLSSILSSQLQSFPQVVYTDFNQYQNFSTTLQPDNSAGYSYFRMTLSTQSLADYVSGVFPLGGVMTSYMKWANLIYSNIVGIAIPYVSSILSGINFEKTVVVGSDISVQNGQGFQTTVNGFVSQSAQQYDLSGWNSGTAGLLLSYWNVT